MQQEENRHESANPCSLQEAPALHGPEEIMIVRHEGNHSQRGQLSEPHELFRRAYRMVERFRGSAGADSAGESQNKSEKYNGWPIGLVRLLGQAGRIDERKPFPFSLNFQ